MKPVAGRVGIRYCGRIAIDPSERANASDVPCPRRSRRAPHRTRRSGHRARHRGARCALRRDAPGHRCGALQHCRRAASRARGRGTMHTDAAWRPRARGEHMRARGHRTVRGAAPRPRRRAGWPGYC
ncbi:hypothetical protein P355_0101 [Burkholderia cenocepacia KC-01]|nr:hypothetical protein P355_0101 [Burkholderia cenocepacia KC-01]